MKPPPPMLPANGKVTSSANPVATAASTALPPFLRISAPASLARLLLLTTIACCSTVGGRRRLFPQPSGKAACTVGVEAVVGPSAPGLEVLHPESTSIAASVAAPAERDNGRVPGSPVRWWREVYFTVNGVPCLVCPNV